MTGTTPDPGAASCTCTPGMCLRGDFRDHQGESPGCMSCADLDPDQPCYAGPTRGDPVAARLGYLRATLDAAIAQPEAFDLPVLLGGWGKALDALEAALTAHEPTTRRPNWSLTCRYDNHRWPCPEYRAISAALTGEGDTGAAKEERRV